MSDRKKFVVMYCAKCNFRLVRKNLYMQNGTVGPGNNKTETCPNGYVPLWPVSWEQEAREGYKLLDSCYQRLENIKQEKQSLAEMHDALIKEYSDLKTKKEDMKEIIETLKNADNESASSPYWLILDPKRNMRCNIHELAGQITGPFFCREDAEDFLERTRYNFSSRAKTYCLSGNYSKKYDNLCRELRK